MFNCIRKCPLFQLAAHFAFSPASERKLLLYRTTHLRASLVLFIFISPFLYCAVVPYCVSVLPLPDEWLYHSARAAAAQCHTRRFLTMKPHSSQFWNLEIPEEGAVRADFRWSPPYRIVRPPSHCPLTSSLLCKRTEPLVCLFLFLQGA